MAKNVRNEIIAGIIITVVGGIILWFFESARDSIFRAISFIWGITLWGWNWLFSDHSVQGWILLLLFGFAAFGALTVYIRMRPNKAPEHNVYVTDILHGAKWRWSWRNNSIFDLWCYCPKCDGILVYDDFTTHRIIERENKTEFICENCGNEIIASINGNKNYAVASIEREIDRRVRTSEYKSKTYL